MGILLAVHDRVLGRGARAVDWNRVSRRPWSKLSIRREMPR